jgi:hypothetical protein
MNKSENVRKKMDQFLIKKSNPIKLEELHLVLIKKVAEIKKKAFAEASEQYKLFNYLNPRYVEQVLSPEAAYLKLNAMSLRSNQGLIRPY